MRHLALALLFVTGCTAADAGPFDPEDGIDDTVGVDVDGKADSTRSCTPKTVAPYALGGTLLLPTGPRPGYVVVENEKIVAIAPARQLIPAGTRIVETGGVISPGFVDLHNHVHYDFIPLWNSGRRWQNRYQWARAAGYAAVKTPYNAVKNGRDMCEAGKYGEFRALVGGTTAIQGMSTQQTCTNAWVRNVEYSNFCADHVRQDVLPISTINADDAARLNAQFESGQTRAFFVHLAEGVDDGSRAELDQLRALGLVKPQVVGIHSTALTPAQLAEMGQAGMKIVWSPLSNLLLYGKTTDIPTALANHIQVALAPDWSPSGSANLLGELKVADRLNRERFGGLISDAQLVAMATSVPAAIAGLDDKLGTLAPGYYADLVVVAANGKSPYRSVIEARPEDVLLTAISGAALYGDATVIGAIGQARSYTTVDACGQARQLAVQDPSSLPLASETLEQIGATFGGDGVASVVPLFQCDGAPEAAFQ